MRVDIHGTDPSGKVVQIKTDANGNLSNAPSSVPIYSANSIGAVPFSSADATTAGQVIAGVASTNIYLTDIVISVGSAMTVTMQDNTGTPIPALGPLYLPANSVFSKTFSVPIKIAVGKSLMVKASVAGNISVTATGYQI